MSVTSPRLADITAAAAAGGHPVVTGCAGDAVVVDGAIRPQRFGIEFALRAAGIEHVLEFDVTHGFAQGTARDAAQALLTRAGADIAPLSFRMAVDVADVAATILATAEDPFAVVIYDADVLFHDQEPSTYAAAARLRAGARDAECAAPRGASAPPRNTLVLVSATGHPPAGLETMPGARCIHFGSPGEPERRAVLGHLGPYFYGADRAAPGALSAALDKLARRTPLQPLFALEQIRRASHDRQIDVTATRELVDTLTQPVVASRAKVDVPRVTAILSTAIVGQEHVLGPIIERISLREFPDAMYDPDGTTARPDFFVLLGTPGCGKTDLGQKLALALYGSPDLAFVIRGNAMKLDHETASITGAPAGYAGYRDGQSLGEQVAGLDEFVLLVDEFDRANRNVLEMLLSVFEEGCLPTSRSSSIDMRHCAVVMTSNKGAKELAARIKLDGVAPPREEVIEIHRKALELALIQAADRQGRDMAALWSRVKKHLFVFDVLRVDAVAPMTAKFADWVVTNVARDWPLNVRYDAAGLAAAVERRLTAEGNWDAREVRALVDELLHDFLRRALVRGQATRGSAVEVTFPGGDPSIRRVATVRAA